MAFQFISAILIDSLFLCHHSLVASFAASHGYHVWRYYYDEAFPSLAKAPDLGVYHSYEIPGVFDNYPVAGATPAQIALSKYMQETKANFAKNPSLGPS